LKICIFGAGAVGGHLAVLLARAGAQVSLVVRGANLEAIRANGLWLHTDNGALHAQVQASDDAASLGPQDAVLITAKSTALPKAAPAIAALLGPDTPAVFLQNGIPWWYYHGVPGDANGQRLSAIDPGDALWTHVGPHRAVGGVTSSACSMRAPGVVEVKGGNRPMVLGEPDGSLSPRVEALAAVLREAGFAVECTPRIRDRIWAKLALNLASGPMGMLAPVPLKDLFVERACIEARFRILAEVAAIADAMGCGIQVDFGTQMAFVKKSPHLPSIVQDTVAGRKPEIETMFRAPLQMAREKGVATPTLDLLVALATIKARGAGLYP
jgi:2-dehydropantoate 2-reductase